MPPKSANLDGVNRPAGAQPSQAQANDVKTESKDNDKAVKDRSSIEAELKSIQATPPKTDIKASKTDRGPVITILITLILMVLLIGLAYFAYNKSK